MRGRIISGLLAALPFLLPSAARAQLWTPLDTVPTPNAIIAHDTSVTMGINTGCTNCHNPANSRLEAAKQDILQTLPLFSRYFNFGAFQYSGCDYAKITTRVVPTPDAPEVSLSQVMTAIGSASACGSKEERLPGGDATTCATPGCIGDNLLVVDLVNGALPGFDPLAPFRHDNCAYEYVGDFLPCVVPETFQPTDATGYRGACYHIGCDPTIGGIEGFLWALAQLPAIDWPSWTASGITPQQVMDDLCNPVRQVLTDVYNQIIACNPFNEGYSTFETTINSSSWCVPGLIAQNACVPGSPFFGTCVCDNSNPACIAGGAPESACGVPFTWKARQQVAVCESWQLGGVFDSFFESQPDNVVNGQCRENAVLFFTDGYMGHTAGTAAEAFLAVPTYESVSGFSNMAVFRIADTFTDQANAMMSAMTDGLINTAYSATDEVTMQESFSRLLNRIYKGVYRGAAMSLDSQGTRAVFHTFTVPGYNEDGPISDNYLGWPARLSMHEIAENGAISAQPLWETDWADKVGGASGCGPAYIGVTDQERLGPDGVFRNGINRDVTIPANSIDRDGDNTPDNHPALRFGKMFSIASTRPVIVEAPREAPNAKYGGELIQFIQRPEVRGRPRAIYVMGNGYVHGFHGGTYNGTPTQYGGRQLAFSYDDTNGAAGTEIMRYGPSWVSTQGDYNYTVNHLIQQPLTTGQLVAREVRIPTPSGYQFRTVLVGAQGQYGRGYFSLDVTDPCNPQVIREWLLPPGATASAEPMIYMLPRAANDPDDRAVVITTGGLGGPPALYIYDIVTGDQISSLTLPGGGSYLSAPVCLDATGDARITHCYVVREDGALIRARINADGRFGNGPSGEPAYADITPPNVSGGGRRFTTSPAVFFDPSGNVNLVFGSGDFERLTEVGPTNYFYKVVDRSVRRRVMGNGAADIDTACDGNIGQINLGPEERVISPPIIAKGVVAWTTYRPSNSGCFPGQARLYAMNYLTCNDAVTGNGPPQGEDAGLGLPTSPVLHRDSQTLLVGTAAAPTADQTTRVDVLTKGGSRPWVKRLYWRPAIDVR